MLIWYILVLTNSQPPKPLNQFIFFGAVYTEVLPISHNYVAAFAFHELGNVVEVDEVLTAHLQEVALFQHLLNIS